MTRSAVAAGQVGGVELLERAIAYALGVVQGVTPSLLEAPTPCRDWDLRELLDHLDDSLAALHEGLVGHRVDPDPAGDPGSAGGARADPAGDPARRFPNRARRLLETVASARDGEVVAVADLPLSAAILASTGAIEIAVHGWDIARACGRDRPVPDGLAVELLRLCPLLVADAGRGGQFAAPVAVGATAAPGDRLIAYLGRDPGT